MKTKDKLPVLPFSPPKAKDTAAESTTGHTPSRTNPDMLAHAIEALRAAMAVDHHTKAGPANQDSTDTTWVSDPDSFTPIGAPKSPPPQRLAQKVGRVGVAAGAVTQPNNSITKPTLTRRITTIHLPRFAMERWARWAATQNEAPPEDIPAALATEGHHGSIIHATNRAAETEGVHIGARVVDMRALCPDLKVTFADIGGDQKALEKLMLWARRWCPWTAIDGPAGLVLDTTGADHLWGGEAAMLRDMEERFARLGLSANLAVSPTHGASWALSRFGGVREVCTADALSTRMSNMPVRALRLTGDTVQLLNRLGLKSVGDLMAVPRVSLARRFSRADLIANPLLRLDQMMDRLAEPVSAHEDPPRFVVQANLAEPVQDPTPHLPALCKDLCAQLTQAGFGARRIQVRVFRTDGEVSHIDVATAQANRDPDHLLRLFDDQLERINPGFGFDLITLGATMVEAMQHRQPGLSQKGQDGADLPQLLDRLTARLGAHAVTRPTHNASHMPERAEVWQPALQNAQTTSTMRTKRPTRLLDPPEEVRVLYAVPEGPPAQFVWRRVTRRVVRFSGPERIAPEWWQDMPGTRLRDYYNVEDQLMHRLWLYRHGVLGDYRGTTPRWFVHGVFA
ncbi:DNA polymerase Y family protein [Loktanella sp. F6476L]|uniref:Y-family DNA polymerase n=1 Tax=Loktanella sp. F6476L TaxID=2926405 RepID=UPI0032B24072